MGHEATGPLMPGIIARVPAGRRRALARAATAVALLLLASTAVLGAPLRTAAAPLGIVSLQLAASPAVAEVMLASWGAVPRARLLWAHGLDLVLPVAYALAITLTVADVARRSRVAVAPVRTAAVAAVAAAVADQVENVAMLATILTRPSWASVIVTLAAAVAKFALLALALGALAAVLVAARADRSRPVPA
jgi:hypothetical protein